MSTYTKFAIIAAGGVGGTVADELLKKGDAVSVSILTRDESKPELQAFKARGATLHQVAYDDEAAVAKALAGSEVVVSTVSPYNMGVQKSLVPAAKAAGVQLFVPAEYGVRVTEGPNVTKKEVQDLLTQHQIPFTIFYTGLFAEFLPYFLDYHYADGYMNVVGKGETAFSITARSDVGRFVAHVVSTAPKSALAGAKIPFEAERLSPLQIHALAEKKLDKKIEVRHVDLEENRKKFDTDFVAFLTTLFEEGRGVAGTEQEVQESVAKFFPDWNPSLYESFIA
ncbi:Phenylcoumaran benzylic ether reductase PT1 [Phytophthora ramorum]|uniref:Phenylcoumaran benzylic ether reductase PT1 n=1 Tax=Phytophthora ramorum TaxID=164328 RepID=UPI0030A006CE|nr:Phenylcoumaran benzylic ether reductase PT1 [Phytophthora ramorum]